MTRVAMRIEYEGPKVLRANQLFTATLRIVADETIHAGGRIVIAARHVSDMGDAQSDDSRAENYLAVTESPAGTQWRLGPALDAKRHPWNRGIELRLEEGTLEAGAAIAVTLGDPARGSPGHRAQSFAEAAFRFRLGVDARGDGDWRVLPAEACPSVRIVGAAQTGLRVVVPQPTAQTVTRTVWLKPEDAYSNTAGRASGAVSLLLEGRTPVGRARLRPHRATRAEATIPPNRGGAEGVDARWRTITVASDDGAIWSRSNPFGPSPLAGYQLYWGEIHGQSGLCDGTNTPAEIYAYAREAAGLDFAAVSSHDFELTDYDWNELRRAARKAHQPGEFVTFLGYEWSGKRSEGGDHNIYFLDDDGPLVYSAPFGAYPAWDAAQGQVTRARNLRETIAELQGRRFMIVPHCGGRRCNFEYYDPRVMPLFEIHSCHRTYEDVAQEAIARGLRVGFIGGSDDHRGALGDSHPAARERFFSSHSGLVAAYARELTRACLWEAFFARRVYATNGPRIVLAVSVNGAPMGSELIAPPGSALTLTFWTRLDGLLDRIEIVKDRTIIRTMRGARNQLEEFAGELRLEADAAPHAYYVTVFQTDGGRAWSSPIWIGPVASS